MKKNIIRTIKTIVLKKTKKKVSDNFNFIKSKLLDSIDVLDIISEIENKFKVKFSRKELSNLKNLDLKKITHLVKKKL